MIPNPLKEPLRAPSSRMNHLLGAACVVHLGRPTSSKESKASANTMSGVLLEVRRLWRPPPPSPPTEFPKETPGNGHEDTPLYAYVRIKEVDHRLSGWFPLRQVEFKDPPQQALEKAASRLASDCIQEPILSSVYTEVTAGMARTQRAKKELNYFEERLLRDGMTPTTVRNFVYLNRFVFRAWYYAPYGLLHPAYDPVVPLRLHPPPAIPNPFIKDAFLCPFSLRVFTTYEQMCYETRAYRGGRLHPPGSEIYRDDRRGFSLFMINGSQHVTYCRHLFCIGKSFLENKLAGHDVHSYYFYVVALHHGHFPRYVDDPNAMYFAGYFTWEKRVAEFNLACILTLPCFAGRGDGRLAGTSSSAFSASDPSFGKETTGKTPCGPLRGIGQFMIAVSYELAYRRHQVGGPERPFSDLGAVAYTRFWRCRVLRWLHAQLTAGERGRSPTPAPRVEEGGKGVLGKRQRPPSSAARLSKRRNTKETPLNLDSDSSSEEERAHREAGDALRSGVSIGEIAREIGLEEADVLETVRRMGLVHYSAEHRNYCLMIPRAFVEWEVGRLARWELSTECATFNPDLLRLKPSAGAGGVGGGHRA
ncbi:unnamed protein product [Phytomonas sp. EM1]|nr:unnamed protein product [Phytomonas sp. EM1]|eukprot:CCW62269.1 unnamed protein product [Phytomonas sp. isolate EM1]